GDDEVRLRALIVRAEVVGYELGRPDEGDKVAAQATALLTRVGADELVEADLLTAAARIAYGRGLYDDARAKHERALGLREKRLGPDHESVATSLHLMAIALDNLDRAPEALPLLR